MMVQYQNQAFLILLYSENFDLLGNLFYFQATVISKSLFHLFFFDFSNLKPIILIFQKWCLEILARKYKNGFL